MNTTIKNPRFAVVASAAVFAAGLLVIPIAKFAQTPAPKASGYTVPRTTDGKPDFRGIWQARNTAAYDIQDHTASLGIPAGRGVVVGGEIPYLPEAAAKKKENFKSRATRDPLSKCYMAGTPRLMYLPFPFQIFQGPGWVAILSEYAHTYRYIRTDGSPHMADLDFWMGDPRGRWEGNTLVIDSVSFNDQTWFDMAGNFHSEKLHTIERVTRTDTDTLTYEVTIEDSKTFSKPWKMSMPLYRNKEKDAQILEYECYAYAEDAKTEQSK